MLVTAGALPEGNKIGIANVLVLQGLDNYVSARDGATATINWV
jgi:hypothetical protein